MAGSILGNAVVRIEDPELLLGRATYVDNLPVEGVTHLAFVRSPYAHAVIGTIDTSAAEAMPGVIAVLTASDLALPRFHAFGMSLNDACARPPLADDKARFVGDPVAVVVALTKAQAVDAVEAVVVDYEPLEVVVDMEAALQADAPLQFDVLGTNLVAGLQDPPELRPLDGADVVVRLRTVNQRIAVVPMEGNAITVIPGDHGPAHDGAVAQWTIHVSTQMPHLFGMLASRLFQLKPGELRVIAPNVGGGFGGKAGITAEHVVAIAVAHRLGRPVRWVETRQESMQALPHGRGQVQYVEMGFTRDGRITGLACRIIGDAGAYAGFGGGLSMGPTRTMAQGVYEIPSIRFDVAVALTNTTPMGAFRGAGRPEAAAFLERLMDLAADELDIDPVELRKRNFLTADQFPYTTRTGANYDVGDYAMALDELVRVAGYDDLRREQARRIERGDTRLLGIGVASYVEVTAGGMSSEYGALEIHDDGTATVSVGTSGHGQGHATSFAMIVADKLGIPVESVTLVQSDTALVPRGSGTGGSRSLQIGGSAVAAATDAVLVKAKDLAASLLEAAVDDIVVLDGKLGVAGVPSTAIGWGELAVAARHQDGQTLGAALDFTQTGATFPFGSHLAVVEVDIETGKVRLVRHVAVDDCGRVLNPMIVAGQQHGGIAQGVAQALWEQVVYDDDGNLLTSTLAEYAMPSAAELPSFETSNTETPTPLNPLGAKGIGESGTIGSMPAVQNAVVDAVSHLGVRHIDMPCTPERVWQAITDAAAGDAAPIWREPPAVFATLPVRGASRAPAAADIDV
jgi:carbon-monoxide dehydrogenase large subunit